MTTSYTRWPKIIDASLRSAADVFRTPELIIVILQSSLLLNVRERWYAHNWIFPIIMPRLKCVFDCFIVCFAAFWRNKPRMYVWIGGGIKRCFCLTSVWRLYVCLSVTFIGPKSLGRPRGRRGVKRKEVKDADLYNAFIEVPYTQGAQVRITQCYLQTTPYLPLPRKHSPDGASQTEVADI